ncbi:MAG: sulfite exporter TauE/SafE family protein [Flavobacteriales bacterium]
MTTYQIASLIVLGLAAGALSGFVGVGGGIIIVPALVYIFEMNQMQAQGVSLAVLLMPVGFLGVWNYYQAGNVQFSIALVIALGFVFGSYFGSKIALQLPEYKIKFIFALVIIIVAIDMLWKSGHKWWNESL